MGDGFLVRDEWLRELETVSHRKYTTGFALGKPDAEAYRYDDGGYIRGYDFAAIVESFEDGMLVVQQRNHLEVGDEVDLLLANGENRSFKIESLYDQQGLAIRVAPHAKQKILIKAPQQMSDLLAKLSYPLIIRRRIRG